MSIIVGQTITDVITIRDPDHIGITGLDAIDFDTLEAFSVTTPATTVDVDLEELNDGQYVPSFAATIFGKWALHYVYIDLPTFQEDTLLYDVVSSAEVTVVTSGGTWTYDGDLTIPANEVRFLIQDTDGSNPLFVDTEIAYALGSMGNHTRKAAASLVERLMARYAGMADTTELDLSVRASQLYDHAKDLLASLNNPFSGVLDVKPYAGGISQADMMTNTQNTDRTPGIFDKGPWIGRNDWGGIRH